MRQRIAQKAARIMAETGVRDFLSAKRKAAAQLGAADTHNMPNNNEIEQAVMDYQSLFKSDTQPILLGNLFGTVLEAMEFFSIFNPRLVGSLLTGIVNEHSTVELHLFAETTEEITFFLMDNSIPYEHRTQRLRMTVETYLEYPGYRFVAGETAIELTVFPHDGLRQAPLSPVDGKPMQRATIDVVRQLSEAVPQ